MRDLLACWVQIPPQWSLTLSQRKRGHLGSLTWVLWFGGHCDSHLDSVADCFHGRTEDGGELGHGNDAEYVIEDESWDTPVRAPTGGPLRCSLGGCLDGQKDARSATRCLGLSKGKQPTIMGTPPSQRERWMATGTNRGRWGWGGLWKSYKGANRERVPFQLPPDPRTKCQLLRQLDKLQPPWFLLSSYPCCYRGASEMELSKVVKEQKRRPGRMREQPKASARLQWVVVGESSWNLFSRSWRPKAQKQFHWGTHLQGHPPSRRSRRESGPFPSSFWWPSALLVPGLCHSSLRLRAHITLSYLPV